MPAVYQTSYKDELGIRGNIRATLVLVANDGRESNLNTIMPGPQGRGIRKESVILPYRYQTTAKNPIARQSSTFIGNSPNTRNKIRIKM